MRKSKLKTLLFIILVIAIIGAVAFGIYYVTSHEIIDLPNTVTPPPTETTNVEVTKEVRQPSFLFRDAVLEGNKEDVCDVLDITEDEVISENLLSTNVTTSFKWENSKLSAIYSTVEINDVEEYDFARSHQVFSDGILSSTGILPSVSQITWNDGIEHKFSNKLWNEALKTGDLILVDKYDTPEGSILLVTSNTKLDKDIERSRSERVFQTLIVGTASYIDNILKDIKLVPVTVKETPGPLESSEPETSEPIPSLSVNPKVSSSPIPKT